MCLDVFASTALHTATLSVVSPQGPYYPGDRVTLRCDIAGDTDWNQYSWFRNSNYIINGQSQTITSDLPNHVGQYQYTCDGRRGSRPTTSQSSAPVSITVTGEYSYNDDFIYLLIHFNMAMNIVSEVKKK